MIRLIQGQTISNFSLIMRTPGHDKELVYGLLFAEGIIQQASDIRSIQAVEANGELSLNELDVELSESLILDAAKFERQFASYSGCGLCGKTSLQALELKQSRAFKPVACRLDSELIGRIKHLLAEQPLFSQTGGVHAAGLVYQQDGQLQFNGLPFFEDVGRHNALDKLVGHELIRHDLNQPGILVLSGRIGFELVQKAIMAGYSIIVALGAPSNLAIQAANQFNVALVGFAKAPRFNLYTSHRELLAE